jgi:lipopolysaccharide export system protein LptA
MKAGDGLKMNRMSMILSAALVAAATNAPAQEGEEENGAAAVESPARAAEPSGGAETKEEEPYHVEADVTEGYYSAGNQILHGIGNVVIVHGDTTITCDEAFSYEEKNLATLLGNVRVRDQVQNYTLTAGYVEYHRAEKLSVATKSPRLVLERDRPITITSDLMRMWSETEYGEAAGNVKVVSEDVEGYGQKLKYFGKEDRIELSGQPVVRQEDNRLAGELITLYLVDEKLRRARVDGSSRLLYFSRRAEEAAEQLEAPAEGAEAGPESSAAGVAEGAVEGEKLAVTGKRRPPEAAAEGGDGEEEDTPTGRVEAAGDVMEGFFEDGELEHVDITGDAEGHYWPFDEFGRESGEQIDSVGDVIKIAMVEGEVKKIIVEGNAEGVYRPAREEGRAGVTRTAGDRISVFVTDNEVRRIVVFGHARGSYFTEEAPPAQEREATGG